MWEHGHMIITWASHDQLILNYVVQSSYIYIHIYILVEKPAFVTLFCYNAPPTAFRQKHSDASVFY